MNIGPTVMIDLNGVSALMECQHSLIYLDEWEYFCFGGGLDNPTAYVEGIMMFLRIAANSGRPSKMLSASGDTTLLQFSMISCCANDCLRK